MYSTIDLCVLCLTYNKNRKNNLSEDNERIVFEEKCRFVFNENVNIRPEVSYICLNCVKNLNYVYYFKHMCLQNIKTFNNYLDTLETKKYLKVTLTDLQYQKKIELMCNDESANEISFPIEEVLIKEEIDDYCVLESGNVLDEKEAIEENDELSTPEKPENLNDNVHYDSSLNEEHHVIENFLNKVKTETELKITTEEIQIKDECLFEATYSDSEDISNNKLINEGTIKPDCNLTFSEDSKKRKTDQNVDNAELFKCDKCHKIFPYLSYLKIHSRTHTGERPFECTTCKKSFKTIGNLNVHNRMHTGEKPYKCDVCNKKFTTNNQLIVHKRNHNNERPFKCSVCQKAFVKSDYLSQHMRIHTGKKPFQCQICQYKCVQKNDLKKHMRKHTGEKPFQCEVCQYKCAQACGLKAHMRKHTGEKPFQCELCEFKCGQTGDLRKHMRKHTGEKPFKCERCQFECAYYGGIKVHMRLHTGERPFTCKHCQKAFNQSVHLKQHVQTHHTNQI